MTDVQFASVVAAILSGLGTIGVAIKWGLARIVKSNDAGTAALIANTASNAVLMVKIEQLCTSNERLRDKLDSITSFVEEHTPVDEQRPRVLTPSRGTRGGEYRQQRAASKADRGEEG